LFFAGRGVVYISPAPVKIGKNKRFAILRKFIYNSKMAKKNKEFLGYLRPKGKKTRQGCSNRSKGLKRYRGQGGLRKRCKSPKK